MNTVWIQGSAGNGIDPERVSEGDYVLRPGDGKARVGIATGEDIDWLDEFDLSTLDHAARQELSEAPSGLTEAEEQESLFRAARGVHDARTHRGG